MAAKKAQISCINKVEHHNPYQRITHIGGRGDKQWKITQEAAIDYIERDEWDFYVDVRGRRVWIVVAISRFGHKYIKTEDDGDIPNNLLSLPECP
jgi:hypothetical protein